MMGNLAEKVFCDLKQRHSREINNQPTCHDGAIFKNDPASPRISDNFPKPS